ncbi:hypothetical protein [Citrobacter freundii]|jgi:hypothetical protein|uniref:hypothetical protein n=1 Tax=Citrobacter freundii TaxID=546 RepID=UPI0022E0748C|nr:hypothetical protein [Citrobacter freundii]
MTTNHPANGPVSVDRLHQISEILSKAAAQSDGGNLGYAMADAVKVINAVLEARNAEPVVLEEKRDDDGSVTSDFDHGWNACRATMLQAGNSPLIGIDLAAGPDRTVEARYCAPPGYVMVPIEPTEDMVIAGFESRPDKDFSEPELWDEYQEMSGCQQAAHRAKLCWDAMISAAPQQEVKNG